MMKQHQKPRNGKLVIHSVDSYLSTISPKVFDVTMLIPIPSLKDNYIWALCDTQNKHCAIVDPGDSKPVFEFLKKNAYTLTHILVTHHHPDHTAGIEDLVKAANPTVTGALNSPCPEISHHVIDQEIFELNGLNMVFQTITVPGHTLCHCAFLSSNKLFTGDTLFSAGCGRIFEGTPSMMYASLNKLAIYPDATQVFCGHEYTCNNLKFALEVEPHNLSIQKHLTWATEQLQSGQITLPSTLKIEKEINPFLRCTHPSVIQAAQRYSKTSTHDPESVFSTLREWKDNFI